jgi:peptidoglycan/xylan/chitin deacetylase (PgdA/CDA1 family)
MSKKGGISRRQFLQGSATGMGLAGGLKILGLDSLTAAQDSPIVRSVPDKLVVLTFDDAVKTQRTFVAPFLKELGFRASFFVTHGWMNDTAHFMTWKVIAEIYEMGFEIGNHAWTHRGFSTPRAAARMAGELALVERQLAKVGVPRPVSFAWCGNSFGPEGVQVLRDRGYRFARRGMQPETPYGAMQPGPAFDPKRYHPLLIPTTGDAYPGWTPDYFQEVVSLARDGKIVVVQMHGVPDVAHPWVTTPAENFRKYMTYLKENGFRTLALRDVEPFVDLKNSPDDPMLKERYRKPKNGSPPELPVEVVATRADLKYWLENMLRYHRFTLAEAAKVCGFTQEQVRAKAEELGLYPLPAVPVQQNKIRVIPYPGGRHPRIGFKEGAIDPMRGTKASVFLPWDPSSYVVIDLPEAIFCNLGLIFLAHYDIPTIWDDQNIVVENIDWTRGPNDSLSYRRKLPNGIEFGASIHPAGVHVEMELWLKNLSGHALSGFKSQAGIRNQVCVMLKGAPKFNRQTNDNKRLQLPFAAVHSVDGNRWILTAWEHAGRVWGNQRVPCMHSDPDLPGCPVGATVRAHGRLWFYEGTDIEGELKRNGLAS